MTAVVLRADARRLPLPDGCVDLVVTSPPYFGLRSYTDGGAHYAGQIGSEGTPAEWLAALVECTREWVRVLKPSGSIFVNLGDKYQATSFDPAQRGKDTPGVRRPTITKACERCGTEFTGGPGRRFCSSFCGGSDNSPRSSRQPVRNKSLLGLPWRYALACVDELGLILRRDIVWSKPNGLPESVTDRCRSSHEYVFHLVRQPRYYAAVDEIREPQSTIGERHGGNRSGYARATPDIARHFNERELNPLGKLPGSVWSIPSQPLTVPAHLGVDHFAAFPLELPRRCIAGWSPPGVCTVCGEGRRPVADRERIDIRPGYAKTHNGQSNGIPQSGGTKWKTAGRTDVTITGYACACGFEVSPMGMPAGRPGGTSCLPLVRPAVVLDPFAGTGTTLLAASALGRVGIGCDLSMDYARLARWRTQDRGEIAKAMQVPKPPPVMDGQEALFTLP